MGAEPAGDANGFDRKRQLPSDVTVAVERVQADGSVVARHWAEFYATRLDLQAQHTAQDKAAEVNADVPRELADSTVAQPRAVTGAKRAALAAGIHDTT